MEDKKPLELFPLFTLLSPFCLQLCMCTTHSLSFVFSKLKLRQCENRPNKLLINWSTKAFPHPSQRGCARRGGKSLPKPDLGSFPGRASPNLTWALSLCGCSEGGAVGDPEPHGPGGQHQWQDLAGVQGQWDTRATGHLEEEWLPHLSSLRWAPAPQNCWGCGIMGWQGPHDTGTRV